MTASTLQMNMNPRSDHGSIMAGAVDRILFRRRYYIYTTRRRPLDSRAPSPDRLSCSCSRSSRSWCRSCRCCSRSRRPRWPPRSRRRWPWWSARRGPWS
uniref:Uncharacterized protein n=1 Tax=Zea mays TaxID=4577 RepID=C0P4S4_MAIZE|nr:unknown [Zea mays]ACN28405.1 unknown [Zea mays]